MEKMKKNNVTSHYAKTFITINCKKNSTASQQHYNKFSTGLALIPVSTVPDGVQMVFSRTLNYIFREDIPANSLSSVKVYLE